MSNPRWVAVLWLALCSLAAPAPGQVEGPVETTLPTGRTVLAEEVPTIPLDSLPTGIHPWADSDVLRGDASRHLGLGDPLIGTSWLNRPLYAGWLAGEMFGGELGSGLEQQASLFGGYRIGWDFDYYWGVEGRWAFTHADLLDPADATWRGALRRSYYDLHLVYYPWGDSRWRPYAALGMGAATSDFQLPDGTSVGQTHFGLPWSLGVKYYWKNWLTLRLNFSDNLAFGHGPVHTMHQVSLTGDMEVRWGGRRPSYDPYR
ncbi:MAG: outer membrane protein [Pirellulaceae bacterium]